MKPLPRPELRAALVRRRPGDHKGTFGHLLIAAGSKGMAGAAILAARSALRSGAGLVTLAVPAGIQSSCAGAAPEAMTIGLPEGPAGTFNSEAAGRLVEAHRDRGYTALAVGPGLSQHQDASRFLLHLLGSLDLPAVVDADALNILSKQEESGVWDLFKRRKCRAIFTPHPGEMARCLGTTTKAVQADREGNVAKLARLWSGVALLKGHGSLISDGENTVLNPTGGPGLAKGGSGDVLAGLIAGLWTQMLASGRVLGDTAFLAAALGAWLHGKAGDLAQKRLSLHAMKAQDVIDSLPAAFQVL